MGRHKCAFVGQREEEGVEQGQSAKFDKIPKKSKGFRPFPELLFVHGFGPSGTVQDPQQFIDTQRAEGGQKDAEDGGERAELGRGTGRKSDGEGREYNGRKNDSESLKWAIQTLTFGPIQVQNPGQESLNAS